MLKRYYGSLFVPWVVTALLILAVLPAKAFWQQKTSLLPGEYMVSYINVHSTAQGLSLDRYAAAAGWGKPDIKTVAIYETQVIKIDQEHTTAGLCKYLNNDPLTKPEYLPVIFRYDDGLWVPVNLPCVWMDGEFAL